MNGYIVIYNRREAQVYAETSYKAQQLGMAQLKVPKSKVGLVSTMLAETDVPMNEDGTPAGLGTPYVHRPID
jgi:hypothetical protein